MASRYDEVLGRIFSSREYTRRMITGEETDREVVFPLTNEPDQDAIDAEQAAWLRAGIEERRREQRKGGK